MSGGTGDPTVASIGICGLRRWDYYQTSPRYSFTHPVCSFIHAPLLNGEVATVYLFLQCCTQYTYHACLSFLFVLSDVVMQVCFLLYLPVKQFSHLPISVNCSISIQTYLLSLSLERLRERLRLLDLLLRLVTRLPEELEEEERLLCFSFFFLLLRLSSSLSEVWRPIITH